MFGPYLPSFQPPSIYNKNQRLIPSFYTNFNTSFNLVSGSGDAEGEGGGETRAVDVRRDGNIIQVKLLRHF